MTRRLPILVWFLGAILALVVLVPSAGAQGRARPGSGWDYSENLNSRGHLRTFSVHVPASYVATRPMPVVLVFHGAYMNGQMMIYVTRFNKIADRRSFIVVYPDALQGRWQDGRTGNASDDIDFVSDLLVQLGRRLKIDQHRIYGAGISNGGYFVQKLACDTNYLAAVAVVAATLPTSTANDCHSTRKIPVMFFFGTADPLVPSDDPSHNAELGKLGQAMGISSLGSFSSGVARMAGMMTEADAVAFWCQHNQCSLSGYSKELPDVDPHDGTRVKCETFGGYSTEVVVYTIAGGGHNWPGAVYFGPKDIFGNVSHDIDASELIADFFLRHSN